jgi:preprotein translocase subunit SecF
MTNSKTKFSADSEKMEGIDFIRLAKPMGALSILLVLLSLVLIMVKGLNYGIDFSGGTELQVKFNKSVSVDQVRSVLTEVGAGSASVQTFGEANEFLIRIGTPEGSDTNVQNRELNALLEKVKSGLNSKLGMEAGELLRVDTVGPQVGSELKKNGLLAAFYSLLVLLIYISVRFDYAYAPGAIICLVHDSIITLGVFALLGREVNVQIIASILTLIGYSLNDTIVTFDRIREMAPLHRDKSLAFILNKGINETLGRTILTAFSTMLACLGLYFLAGGVIAEIAFTLIIGIIVGAYSTIYVAAPLIMLMDKITPGSTSSIPHATSAANPA